MTDVVQWVAIAVSLGLFVLVIELVRRRRLVEEHSFIWLVCAVALLGLSLGRRFLDVAARWLGVYYPPAVLLLVLVFFVFLASLYFSVVISGQRRQIEHLVEEVAILEARIRGIEGDPVNSSSAAPARTSLGSDQAPRE